jgi:stage III sporulation protein AA
MQEELERIFSREMRVLLTKLDSGKIREIRLRTGQPLMIQGIEGKEWFLSRTGELKDTPEADSYVVSGKDVKETLEQAADYSLYAYEEELRQGYLTIPGGHRVGMAGRAVYEDGGIRTLKYISFLNIRFAHPICGCAAKVLPYLVEQENQKLSENGASGEICHTLIFSPPGCGKTTLLRDLIREVSDGDLASGRMGKTVGVVDERSELAACYQGVPQNHLGIRTDVLDACPKAQGMMLLIRTMTPQVVAVDEIGSAQEVESMAYAMNCGCRILATVHGASLDEIARKPVLKTMMQEAWFERYIRLEPDHRMTVYDRAGNVLWMQA